MIHPNKKPIIRIEVVSDVVCPWCYIGKRRMEKAIDILKEQFVFSVTFSPFELNPGIPGAGINQKEYLSEKFGGDEKYNQVTGHVTKIAAGEGLKFDFAKQNISPNTRDPHRIIWLAKSEGHQPAVKEAFMKSYFEDGVDLSKRENIIQVATSAGLQRDTVTSWLDTGAGQDEVIQAEETNLKRGISGVPFYIINEKYGFSGAQPTEVFVSAFKEIGKLLGSES